MNSEKLKAYVRLCRPANVLITMVSIPVAAWISGGTINDWRIVLLAAFTGALVSAGANAINDFFDIEIDRINRPDRPLPSGILEKGDAKQMWLMTSATAICLNLFINIYALFIVLAAIFLLYLYSARLKRTILVGNLAVASMTGLAIIYGGTVVGGIGRAIIPAMFAFLINFARELVKDAEDIEGDRLEKAVTFPVRYGVKSALALSTAVLVLLAVITIGIGLSTVYKPAFLHIVLIADFLMFACIAIMWNDYTRKNLRRISGLLKVSMIIGLFSIIVGSI